MPGRAQRAAAESEGKSPTATTRRKRRTRSQAWHPRRSATTPPLRARTPEGAELGRRREFHPL